MFWKRKIANNDRVIREAMANQDQRSPSQQALPNSPRHEDIRQQVEFATMTSPQRVWALCDAIDRISQLEIEGDIVECGVWRGGSMMAAAKSLLYHGDCSRSLWLFDTFEGMTKPETQDVDHNGNLASQLLDSTERIEDSVWCIAGLEEVKTNLHTTGYPQENLKFVAGPVEQTLLNDEILPDQIALLRLDTDWYRSTLLELETLFPRLVPGGVLIIDDYGHWQGCQQAVDEYFEANGISMELNAIDYTGRIGIKQAEMLAGEVERVA